MLLPPRYLLREEARFLIVKCPRLPPYSAGDVEDAHKSNGKGLRRASHIDTDTSGVHLAQLVNAIRCAYGNILTFACAKARYVCAQDMLARTAPRVLALGVLECDPFSAAPAACWKYSAR